MNCVLPVYKPIGYTPLEVVHEIRRQYPQYAETKIGYAGRLDPLAQGVLLLMIGDANKKRDQYLGLPKEYIFEVVFGMETDTYDVLGLIKANNNSKIVNKYVNIFANSHVGKFHLPYPPYSSKTVKGKPLFWWAKQNRLSDITIPTKAVEITLFEVESMGTIDKETFKQLIKNRIKAVHGDFRQEQVLLTWNAFFQSAPERFVTGKFRIRCSSGTYVRGLINELGQSVGSRAVALDILRTSVGDYSLNDALALLVSGE